MDVVGAGVSGYGTRHQRLWFEELAPALQPDEVVLQFFVGNDFEDSTTPPPRIVCGWIHPPGDPVSLLREGREVVCRSHAVAWSALLDAEVTMLRDSLGRVVEELQGTAAVGSSCASLVRAAVHYPGTDRVVEITPDALGRTTGVQNITHLDISQDLWTPGGECCECCVGCTGAASLTTDRRCRDAPKLTQDVQEELRKRAVVLCEE